jgi:hypothetical protein
MNQILSIQFLIDHAGAPRESLTEPIGNQIGNPVTSAATHRATQTDHNVVEHKNTPAKLRFLSGLSVGVISAEIVRRFTLKRVGKPHCLMVTLLERGLKGKPQNQQFNPYQAVEHPEVVGGVASV